MVASYENYCRHCWESLLGSIANQAAAQPHVDPGSPDHQHAAALGAADPARKRAGLPQGSCRPRRCSQTICRFTAPVRWRKGQIHCSATSGTDQVYFEMVFINACMHTLLELTESSANSHRPSKNPSATYVQFKEEFRISKSLRVVRSQTSMQNEFSQANASFEHVYSC